MTDTSIFTRILNGEIPAEIIGETDRLFALRDIAPQLIEPTSFAAKLAACLPAAPANEPAPAVAPHAEPAAPPRPRTAVRADIDDTLDLDAMLPSIAPPMGDGISALASRPVMISAPIACARSRSWAAKA